MNPSQMAASLSACVRVLDSRSLPDSSRFAHRQTLLCAGLRTLFRPFRRWAREWGRVTTLAKTALISFSATGL
jgi:hypothetical protein